MAINLENNATSKLSGSITAEATSISVQSGEGERFPAPVSPNWFPVTLIDAAGNIEICKCTARSGDILTVERGQEGTTARTFAAGSRVSLRITKAVLDYVFGVVDQLTGTTISSFIKTILDDEDAASARTTLGAQASDATLTALAGLTGAADRLPYFNGADTAALAKFTSFARSLLDDVDAASARATLGVLSAEEPYKAAADVATTENLPWTYYNGTSGNGATLTAPAVGATAIDGIAITSGKRVLVKNQTAASQNGVYIVLIAGDASIATVLARASDCNMPSKLAGAVISVKSGLSNGGRLYTTEFKREHYIGSNLIRWGRVSTTYD